MYDFNLRQHITAKRAGQNYKEASQREVADLLNFEQEAQNVINGIEDGEITTNPVTNIELNTTNKEIESSDSFTLTTRITPSNATYKGITWSTSNENIANISETTGGSITVTGIGEGSAVITAQALDGKGAKATCMVTVSAKQLNKVTASNYGDYVNYPINIGRGPDTNAHKTDWRIFYNDGTYVYLISSYYLLNSQMPTGTNMIGYNGKPYTTYWGGSLPAYKEISDVARNQYKISWNKSITNLNIKAVSELLDTSKWSKFRNEKICRRCKWTTLLVGVSPFWCGYWLNGGGRQRQCGLLRLEH